MNYRCPLPQPLKDAAASFSEFANGAAQATIELKDGRTFGSAVISNGTAVIAVRGYDSPPFKADEIARIYQTVHDQNPKVRDGWKFWDEWR